MSKQNNEMSISLTSSDKLRLRRVAEPQTDAEPVILQLIWQSQRTTYHFANLYHYPSVPLGSPRYTAELLDEAGTVSASIPLQSFTARNAALEVVEAKVCF